MVVRYDNHNFYFILVIMKDKNLTELEEQIVDVVFSSITSGENTLSEEIQRKDGIYVDIRGTYEFREVYDKDTDYNNIIGASVSLDIEAFDKDGNKIEINTSAIKQEVEKLF